MNNLPKGDFLESTVSPDGAYNVNFYVANGGATTSLSIRGELVINKNNENKTIYWDSPQESVRFYWIDNNTIVINGQEIKLPNGKFDFRHDK